jgi:hypothetical protein
MSPLDDLDRAIADFEQSARATERAMRSLRSIRRNLERLHSPTVDVTVNISPHAAKWIYYRCTRCKITTSIAQCDSGLGFCDQCGAMLVVMTNGT